MKKNIYLFISIICCLVTSGDLFAENYSNPGSTTLTSIRGGGDNLGKLCNNSSAVPRDSQTDTNPDSPTGTFNCNVHNYYTASTYTQNTSSNGITLCNGEDKVTGISGTSIICTRWDDGSPTVNINTSAYASHNVWTNQNASILFGAADVDTSSTNGTVKSGIQTTRYCWGSSCNLDTQSNGTAASSVSVTSNTNDILRFRTWDKNGNSSGITSVTVKIDKVNPTLSVGLSGGTTTNDTWTNQNVTSAGNCSDTGGSGCDDSSMQYRVQSTSFSTCNGGGTWNTGTSYNHTIPNNAIKVEYICYRVRDFAGNGYVYSSVATIRIDKQIPTLDDVTNTNSGNLLAVDSQSYSIGIDDRGGSPIDLVRYTRENTSNDEQSGIITDSSSPWSFNWDISKVDNYREVVSGGREYTYRLREICDEATNCGTFNKAYDHNVFANTTAITASTSTNELSSSIIADGTVKNISIDLVDQYGNQIIPADGILRTIDVNIGGNNQLRRDQYLNTGTDSAIFVDGTTLELPVSTTTLRELNNRTSSNGRYTIPFYIYAPTNNASSFVPGSANVTISYDVNGSLGVTGDIPQDVLVSSASATIEASPLFDTVISGSVETQGFLEGTAQDISINVLPANSTSTNSRSLRAEFGDVSGSNNIANTRYEFNIAGSTIQEGQQTAWTGTTQLNSTLASFNNASTFMTQDGPVDNQTFSYLASIVKYTRSGKTIVYPGDILGKDSYHGVAGGNNSYQEGIKIIGNTSSQNTQELVLDQFDDDVRIIGKLSKSSFRRDISQNVYEVTRNFTGSVISGNVTNLGDTVSNPGVWNNSDGAEIFGDKVLLFRNPSGGSIDIDSTHAIDGRKTIVVENGDIYIRRNIINATNNDMLGIIVLNGNIYIDSSVTDVHALLYTNQSILSSIGGIPVTTATNTATNLANQLYIKGSIFSENTIGGSRANPIECPYNVTVVCNIDEAQRYDLNYLRRYFTYDGGLGYDVDTTGDTNFDMNRSGQISNAALNNYELAKFPVIIEYNPLIQQTPPPFFD